MDVRNCKECGRLFNYTAGLPICPACEKKLEEKFTEVKQYIYDNPGSGIQEVSEENDVSINTIKKWVREERLSFTEGSAVGIECERCGRLILSGRYCDECKKKVTNQLESAYAGPAKEPGQKKKTDGNPKMRFLNN